MLHGTHLKNGKSLSILRKAAPVFPGTQGMKNNRKINYADEKFIQTYIIIAEKVAGDKNWLAKITGTTKISRRYMIKSSSES